jgi:hypothetical protein
MMREIVKVQLAIASSMKNPPALLYDRRRRHEQEQFLPVSVVEQMKDTYKAFYWADWMNGKWVLYEKAAWQDW